MVRGNSGRISRKNVPEGSRKTSRTELARVSLQYFCKGIGWPKPLKVNLPKKSQKNSNKSRKGSGRKPEGSTRFFAFVTTWRNVKILSLAAVGVNGRSWHTCVVTRAAPSANMCYIPEDRAWIPEGHRKGSRKGDAFAT